MRIYYKKKFWAGVGALLLGLALPGTCLFVGWERFDLKDAVLTMFMVLSGISGILRRRGRLAGRGSVRGGGYFVGRRAIPVRTFAVRHLSYAGRADLCPGELPGLVVSAASLSLMRPGAMSRVCGSPKCRRCDRPLL